MVPNAVNKFYFQVTTLDDVPLPYDFSGAAIIKTTRIKNSGEQHQKVEEINFKKGYKTESSGIFELTPELPYFLANYTITYSLKVYRKIGSF